MKNRSPNCLIPGANRPEANSQERTWTSPHENVEQIFQATRFRNNIRSLFIVQIRQVNDQFEAAYYMSLIKQTKSDVWIEKIIDPTLIKARSTCEHWISIYKAAEQSLLF